MSREYLPTVDTETAASTDEHSNIAAPMTADDGRGRRWQQRMISVGGSRGVLNSYRFCVFRKHQWQQVRDSMATRARFARQESTAARRFKPCVCCSRHNRVWRLAQRAWRRRRRRRWPRTYEKAGQRLTAHSHSRPDFNSAAAAAAAGLVRPVANTVGFAASTGSGKGSVRCKHHVCCVEEGYRRRLAWLLLLLTSKTLADR